MQICSPPGISCKYTSVLPARMSASKGWYRPRVCSQNAMSGRMASGSMPVSASVPARPLMMAPIDGCDVHPAVPPAHGSTRTMPLHAVAHARADTGMGCSGMMSFEVKLKRGSVPPTRHRVDGTIHNVRPSHGACQLRGHPRASCVVRVHVDRHIRVLIPAASTFARAS